MKLIKILEEVFGIDSFMLSHHKLKPFLIGDTSDRSHVATVATLDQESDVLTLAAVLNGHAARPREENFVDKDDLALLGNSLLNSGFDRLLCLVRLERSFPTRDLFSDDSLPLDAMILVDLG